MFFQNLFRRLSFVLILGKFVKSVRSDKLKEMGPKKDPKGAAKAGGKDKGGKGAKAAGGSDEKGERSGKTFSPVA